MTRTSANRGAAVLFVVALLATSAGWILTMTTSAWSYVASCAIVAIVLCLLGSLLHGYAKRLTT